MPAAVVIGPEDVGRLVRDAYGRVGVLRDVIPDHEDPAVMPSERRIRRTAFLAPEKGGREWQAPPDTLTTRL
ncbi:hypothetical protein HHL19_10260 [Streptomyces sp. R302]|uniref:hypothetical protein n=1 Tax=unclassified Streptomyces TaxID=2593676 RepID=UPI00145E697C|nr:MULTISPECIES: hypothetical protein [unclassified Streptomyces]NML50051.1 hypothetical protein [Streptomyces sp. R301]NML79042.1 hypothetical protein [Streptomyces sp. R302]